MLEEDVVGIKQSLADSMPLRSRHTCIPPVSVHGRLRECTGFWREELRASEHICSIINTGYRLPFVKFPKPCFQENHRCSNSDKQFVAAAIADLVVSKCAQRVMEPPLVCSPLQVVSKDEGKRRLVIDLRYVNGFLHKFKFKYEGLDLAAQYLEEGHWLSTFDLKSGYHHIEIHPDYWSYLGFSWVEEEGRAFYVFRVLPFGLATACYIFTKVLRPLVCRWRSLGLRVVLYVDDGLCVAESKEAAEKGTSQILADLKESGFLVNKEKSILTPQQEGKWLGIHIDLHTGNFLIPSRKVGKLKNVLATALRRRMVSARQIAKITGFLMSMAITMGPIVRLRTRGMYALINRRKSWDGNLPICTEVQEEISFWLQNVERLNGRPFQWSPSATRVAYSDASSSGYGGYIVEIGPHHSHGQWSETEAKQSSTWRELKAVDMVLQALATKLEGHTVKWCTDNQNVVSIINIGSRKPHLQDGAMCIYDRCLQHSIKLEMAWIPRKENEMADYLSRIVDFDDWQVDPGLFCWLHSLLGPFTVDNFANNLNAQLPTFHSSCWCPGTSAVDTFTASWEEDINWLVPPLHLVCRALRHARVCSAKGAILIPAWKSAVYWPLILPNGTHFAGFIHDWYSIPYYQGMIVKGRSGHSIVSTMNTESCFLALYFDFSIPHRIPFQQQDFKFC